MLLLMKQVTHLFKFPFWLGRDLQWKLTCSFFARLTNTRSIESQGEKEKILFNRPKFLLLNLFVPFLLKTNFCHCCHELASVIQITQTTVICKNLSTTNG